MLRELSESRSDIVTGPDRGRSVSVFGRPAVAASWVDLQLAQLQAAQQQRMKGALGKVM